jgi:hypothetical protein
MVLSRGLELKPTYTSPLLKDRWSAQVFDTESIDWVVAAEVE